MRRRTKGIGCRRVRYTRGIGAKDKCSWLNEVDGKKVWEEGPCHGFAPGSCIQSTGGTSLPVDCKTGELVAPRLDCPPGWREVIEDGRTVACFPPASGNDKEPEGLGWGPWSRPWYRPWSWQHFPYKRPRPSSWWLWWAGYRVPYYAPYTYYRGYRSCCVNTATGTVYCGGQAYPGKILEVRGKKANVMYRGGRGWYPVCELG